MCDAKLKQIPCVSGVCVCECEITILITTQQIGFIKFDTGVASYTMSSTLHHTAHTHT